MCAYGKHKSVIVCVLSVEKVRDPTPTPPLEGRGAATAEDGFLGKLLYHCQNKITWQLYVKKIHDTFTCHLRILYVASQTKIFVLCAYGITLIYVNETIMFR